MSIENMITTLEYEKCYILKREKLRTLGEGNQSQP